MSRLMKGTRRECVRDACEQRERERVCKGDQENDFVSS
jgi:hypothetical protein